MCVGGGGGGGGSAMWWKIFSFLSSLLLHNECNIHSLAAFDLYANTHNPTSGS